MDTIWEYIKGKKHIQIDINSIYYIELQLHRIFIHLSDNIIELYEQNFTKITNKYTNIGLIKINRGLLVNPSSIVSISKLEITLIDGTVLHASRNYKKNIKNIIESKYE
ncbi:MAG: LytTR family transcriptional regulator DNA-binding domain-containing protein [Alphaproteobacteria bacterium]|nr:LytTR family transcriptional regulator DNA-binding domain-containing protein [Alphaproteobacteria bacterium]MBQ6849544.1 LytTR family transcriptional regulator DNA-binding domain-containing protein [Oscillospiraceae bacterium]